MKPRRVLALFAIFVLFCLIAPADSLASQARIVRLSHIDGNVQIDRPGVDREKAVLNMPVVQGTRLVAENDSAVEVEFENGSTVRMVGPATITFRDLAMRDEGDKVSLVELEPGTYYFDIHHKGDDDFRISAMNQDLRVRKTSRFRIVADSEQAKVAVFKGELQLAGLGEEVEIRKNETLTLNVADARRYFLAKGTEMDPNDAWDKERDDYRETYANAQSWRYSNTRYGGPYSYGVTDLAYYGSFFDVPGYGYLWRPTAFGLNWDPFSNGAWSYYPGQGWVFVSMYPWGWTPYRYGQWVWVPAYGWAWRPTRYTYWHPTPVIQNPPRGWYRPTPPLGSAWNRTVVVNPNPDPTPRPGAWRKPTPNAQTDPKPGGWRPPRPPAEQTAGAPVAQPQGNRDRVGVRQPAEPEPGRTFHPTPRNDTPDREGGWRPPVDRPRMTPPAEAPRQAPPPQRQASPPSPAPQRQASPSSAPPPRVDRAPAPRMESPRMSAPPSRSAPPPARRGK